MKILKLLMEKISFGINYQKIVLAADPVTWFVLLVSALM